MRSFVLLAAMMTASPLLAQQPIDPKVQARIDRILKKTPLIDGHNDIAEQLADKYKRSIDGLASGTDQREKPLMTDMARLRKGRVGGQFLGINVKVQILVDDQVVATQLISIESFATEPTTREIKRLALKRALEDRTITISQSLVAGFRLFDVMGRPLDEEAA